MIIDLRRHGQEVHIVDNIDILKKDNGGQVNIGLIDVDGHNFPNLALMKISAYHKANNDNVYFYDPYLPNQIKYMHLKFSPIPKIMGTIPGYIEIIKGGTGYNIYDKLSEEIEYILPDYKFI